MYDTFSSDYDRFVSWPGRLAYEMPFIEQALGGLAQEQPARVLDAACGTGMHAIALAQRGYPTAGADLSQPMIARARDNAAAAGVQFDFRAAGFGELAAAFDTRPQPFDALLCLGNSLPHVAGLPELRAALADFAACLRPGGLLLLQNRNFDAVMAQRARWMEPQAHREGEHEWLFLRFYDYDPDGRITFNIITLKRAGQSVWQQQVSSTRLYPLLLAELESALAESRFGDVQAFGGLGGEAFDPAASGNLVITARRAA